MGIPVLIIGKSGSGKSASMKHCVGRDFNLVRVLNKPLPFRGKINGWVTDDYAVVHKALKCAPAKSIIIDDAGYLITNYFMKNHSTKGKGNDVFGLYNTLGDSFWNLMITIVLRCVNNMTEHKFITQSDGGAISKSPEGMFEDLEIPNDLLYVDNRIREYYGIQNSKNQEREDVTL